MRLLVTGASGFVGRRLLPVLTAAGYGGIATGRTLPPDLPGGWVGGRRDQILTGASVDGPIDAVVHLEVRQHVARVSSHDIAEFQRVNVDGTRAWIDWAAKNHVGKFVYVSSIKAVGRGPGVHTESDLPTPDTPYGRSKAAAEMIVRDWSYSVVNRVAVVLRPAPVYGPGNEANLAAFVQQVLSGRPCLVGGGAARKSLVGYRNLAAAIAFVLEHKSKSFEVYNVSDAELVAVHELAEMIAAIAGCHPPKSVPKLIAKITAICGDVVERISNRPFPLTTSRLKALCEETVFPCEKLISAGFRHPVTLREGLVEMVAWAKQNHSLYP